MKLKRSSPQQPYSVAYFDKAMGRVRPFVDRLFANTCDAGTTAGGVPITELISSPRFSVKRVSSESDSRGKRLLRLDFSFAPKSGPGGPISDAGKRSELRSGSLLVSPEENSITRGFALVSHAGRAPSTVQVGTVEYEDRDSGIPIPKMVRTRMLKCDSLDISTVALENVRGELFQEESFEVSVSRFGSTPDGDFSAAFFGLPDLGDEARRPIIGRLAAVMFVLAFTGFVVSSLLRFLASHSAPAARHESDVGIPSQASSSDHVRESTGEHHA
jgi:hypothetical protein